MSGILSLAGLIRRFVQRRDGNVATIFALASVPLMLFTGAAIIYGLALTLQTKLQAATDATALSLCQTPNNTTTSTLQTQAQTTMSGYMGTGVGLTVDAITVTSNPRNILIRSHANATNPFSALMGRSTTTVTATSKCGTPLPKTFEIALVLDNTGSMNDSSGTQSKIDALKIAASNFVDYVFTNGSFASDSRIAIVPFAATVKLDPTAYASASWVDTGGVSAYHWTNVDKTQARALGFTSRLSIFNALKAVVPEWAWGGCFESLPYPQNTQDGVPTSNDTLYVPLFAPDEPGVGNTGSTSWGLNTTYNSYIDDWNGSFTCNALPLTFQAAESQACKYVNPRNARYTTNNSAVGLPNGPNFQCVSKPLQRLTGNTNTLKSLLNSLTASGSTNIHEGVMWGWRTLSPNSVFGDGAPYTSSTTNKIIVLMTDGTNSWPDNAQTNYNKTLFFPLGYVKNADGSDPAPRLPTGQAFATTGQQRNALDALTQTACTNAKAAGISIYTIGFSVLSGPIDQQGITLLENCATNAGQAYIANDSNGLIAAFNKIATSIGSLRLVQ